MYRTFMQSFYSNNLLRKAEGILNGLLDSNACNNMYIVNPDGTKVRLQYGFRIENDEIICDVVRKNLNLE